MTPTKLSNRPILLFVAGALLGAAGFAVPHVRAADRASPFAAELLAPTAKPMAIVRGAVFHCDGVSCTGGHSDSPPKLVCGDTVRTFGKLKRFTVDGRALDDAQLAACNAKA